MLSMVMFFIEKWGKRQSIQFHKINNEHIAFAPIHISIIHNAVMIFEFIETIWCRAIIAIEANWLVNEIRI